MNERPAPNLPPTMCSHLKKAAEEGIDREWIGLTMNSGRGRMECRSCVLNGIKRSPRTDVYLHREMHLGRLSPASRFKVLTAIKAVLDGISKSTLK